MHFWVDINGETWFFIFGSVCVSLLLTLLCMHSYRVGDKVNLRLLSLAVVVSILPLTSTYDAYCPDADQLHVEAIGGLVPERTYKYRAGKHDYEGLLAHLVQEGRKSQLLEFNAEALGNIKESHSTLRFRAVYLERLDFADIENGMQITAYPVVEVTSSDTGERIYYRDTKRHWPRVILLLFSTVANTVLFALSFWFYKKAEKFKDSPDDVREEPAQEDHLVGLGLSGNGELKKY
jgi:hypothetical protein